ncbi:MAG TPA: universal stress protein [Parafilimonas sp.]|nr:universal stress protein [Parafilimonas sp.]
MLLFTNILIPVDFSENANVAVQKAIELAQPANSVIHLFNTENVTAFGRCVCYGYCFYTAVIDKHSLYEHLKLQYMHELLRKEEFTDEKRAVPKTIS